MFSTRLFAVTTIVSRVAASAAALSVGSAASAAGGDACCAKAAPAHMSVSAPEMATTRLERWNLQDLIVLMSLLPESGLLGYGA